MAPRSRHATPAVQTSTAQASSPATQSKKSPTSTSSPKNTQDVQQIVQDIWSKYLEKTPQRAKLIDAFMAFLVVVGGLQFLYCVVAGNYVSFHSAHCDVPVRAKSGGWKADCGIVPCSRSMLSCRASAPPSVSSFLPPACGCRRILRTRRSLRIYLTRGMILSSDPRSQLRARRC